MTLEQLRQRFPDATEETWHPHANGGGWVQNTVDIDDKTVVEQSAIVAGRSLIRGSVIWGGEIRGGVIRGGEIRGGVIRGGEIRGGVIWGGEIRGGEIRGGEIRGGEWAQAPLFIQGTRHPLTVCEPGIIQIGCMRHPLGWWQEHYAVIGRKKGYSPKEISEYASYIELAGKWIAVQQPTALKPVNAA